MGYRPRLSKLGLVLVFALAGCSGGGALDNINPVNWFGDDDGSDAQADDGEEIVPIVTDFRPQVSEVSRAWLEPTRFGAILRAEGIMRYPAQSLPDLRAATINGRPDEDGVLRYDMVASTNAGTGRFTLNNFLFGEDPTRRREQNPTATIAATYVPQRVLDGAQAIEVSAQDGAISIPLR